MCGVFVVSHTLNVFLRSEVGHTMTNELLRIEHNVTLCLTNTSTQPVYKILPKSFYVTGIFQMDT